MSVPFTRAEFLNIDWLYDDQFRPINQAARALVPTAFYGPNRQLILVRDRASDSSGLTIPTNFGLRMMEETLGGALLVQVFGNNSRLPQFCL
jgi:hypothetical protein